MPAMFGFNSSAMSSAYLILFDGPKVPLGQVLWILVVDLAESNRALMDFDLVRRAITAPAERTVIARRHSAIRCQLVQTSWSTPSSNVTREGAEPITSKYRFPVERRPSGIGETSRSGTRAWSSTR